jgi:hypothetical protein
MSIYRGFAKRHDLPCAVSRMASDPWEPIKQRFAVVKVEYQCECFLYLSRHRVTTPIGLKKHDETERDGFDSAQLWPVNPPHGIYIQK